MPCGVGFLLGFLILQGISLALQKLYLGKIGPIQPDSRTPAICRIRGVTLHFLAGTLHGGRYRFVICYECFKVISSPPEHHIYENTVP